MVVKRDIVVDSYWGRHYQRRHKSRTGAAQEQETQENEAVHVQEEEFRKFDLSYITLRYWYWLLEGYCYGHVLGKALSVMAQAQH